MEVVPGNLCVPKHWRQTCRQGHQRQRDGMFDSYLALSPHYGETGPTAGLHHNALEHRSRVQQDNPADKRITAALGTNARPSKHLPAVHHTEVAAGIVKIQGSSAYPTVCLAAEFAILTVTRSGETRGAKWSEIDIANGLWEIPAKRMKANRPHQVPLSNRAVDVLREATSFKDAGGLVFPNRDGPQIPDWVFPKLFKSLNMDGTLHGMRTAFRNWCAEKGISREVAETCLAHRIGTSAEQAYRRTNLLTLRQHLMEEWSPTLKLNRSSSRQTAVGWEQAAKVDAHIHDR